GQPMETRHVVGDLPPISFGGARVTGQGGCFGCKTQIPLAVSGFPEEAWWGTGGGFLLGVDWVTTGAKNVSGEGE
ncbi:hypothetical protein CRG98_003138, partial [Punica granatum]